MLETKEIKKIRETEESKDFSDSIHKIKTFIKYRNYEFILELKNIDIVLLNSIDWKYNSACLWYKKYFSFTESIFDNVSREVFIHLLNYSPNIKKLGNELAFSLCFGWTLDTFIKLENLYNLEDKDLYKCLKILLYRASNNRPGDLEEIYKFLKYLEKYDYNPYKVIKKFNHGKRPKKLIDMAKSVDKYLKRKKIKNARLYEIMKIYAKRSL